MQTFGIVALLSVVFLIPLWMLWKSRGGGSGPVIIITPPPELKDKSPKPLGWRLEAGEVNVPIEFRKNLKEKMPTALLGILAEVDVTVKSGGTPAGFETLTLKRQGPDNDLVLSNDAGRLAWRKPTGTKWRSSAGKVSQWPDVLTQPVDEIEFVDAEGAKFTSAVIDKITIKFD